MKDAKSRGYNDLQDHLAALEAAGLLTAIDAPIDKDSELSPLVRWQFRGGIAEMESARHSCSRTSPARRAVNSIFPSLPARWRAMQQSIPAWACLSKTSANAGRTPSPIRSPPVETVNPPCQELVFEGDDLKSGNGLDVLYRCRFRRRDTIPRRILTATACVTRDPDSGIQNLGTYRGGLKAPDPDRVEVVYELRSGRHRALGIQGPRGSYADCDGDRLSAAGCYCGRKRYHKDTDELGVAGGIAGAPDPHLESADVGSDGAG